MSITVKPVRVLASKQVKRGKETSWEPYNSNTENTEAIIRQVTPQTYRLEVRERGSMGFILKFEFQKIKQYEMKTMTIHKVKCGSETVSLRYSKEDKDFKSFFEQLKCVLELHKKYKKPIYDDCFMEEIRNFQHTNLTSDKWPRNGLTSTVSSEGNQATNSGVFVSGDSLASPPVESSIDSNSQESFRNKKGKAKPNTPKAATGTGPLSYDITTTLPRRDRRAQTDWSDEEHDQSVSSRDEDPDYNLCEIYPVREEPPQVTSPRDRPSQESAYYAVSDSRSPQKDVIGHQSRVRSPAPPPPSKPTRPKPKEDYVNVGNLVQKPRREEPPPPLPPKATLENRPFQISRTISEPNASNPTSAVDRGGGGPTRSASDSQGSQQPQPPSLYGAAQSWSCDKCTLANTAHVLTCKMCDWTRTDAWQCPPDCGVVYSLEVRHCLSCPVWRCQLCTYINTGQQSEFTCEMCGDKCLDSSFKSSIGYDLQASSQNKSNSPKDVIRTGTLPSESPTPLPGGDQWRHMGSSYVERNKFVESRDEASNSKSNAMGLWVDVTGNTVKSMHKTNISPESLDGEYDYSCLYKDTVEPEPDLISTNRDMSRLRVSSTPSIEYTSDFRMLELKMNDLTIGKKLGQGHFASVYAHLEGSQ